MGRKMRLELTTSGTTNQRSNQLSYIRHQLIGLYFARFQKKCQEKIKIRLTIYIEQKHISQKIPCKKTKKHLE